MTSFGVLFLSVLGALPGASPPTVVIDPGHGGSNVGAPGLGSPIVYEKEITLAVARLLARRLEAEGVRVILTRDRDTYLTLRERVRRANAVAPDCFLSLHTNASPGHERRGVETYLLGRETLEVEARRAAVRSDGVDALLAELRLVAAHRSSVALASALQARLAPSGSPADRGVRQAPFDVLAGLAVPAVLVEMGFIDHPVEGAALARKDGQEQIAAALAEGVFDFLARARGPRMAQLAP
jgi:N-acetylmuramoyl-L-alanine amidase